jgi:CheY-like chemotaxis protein
MTKILLVEDDKSLREIYGVRLLAEGYDIVSAGDGEEALAMAIKERPQLIVSDVMMPKISGFDMLDILRSTTETKDIKVIMMTALSSEDQRARGQALGADRYLVKSQVGIEDVVRTVHEVLADAPVATPGATSFSAAPAPADRAASPAVPPRQPAPTYQDTAATPAPGGLPQPTAPFSTPRPSNLGDRVINPIPQEPSSKPDLASLMDQELSNAAPAATPPAPAAPVVPTPAPTAPAVPQAPASPIAPPPMPPAPTNPTQPPAPTAY